MHCKETHTALTAVNNSTIVIKAIHFTVFECLYAKEKQFLSHLSLQLGYLIRFEVVLDISKKCKLH